MARRWTCASEAGRKLTPHTAAAAMSSGLRCKRGYSNNCEKRDIDRFSAADRDAACRIQVQYNQQSASDIGLEALSASRLAYCPTRDRARRCWYTTWSVEVETPKQVQDGP